MTASHLLWALSNASTLDELRRPDALTLIVGDRPRSCQLLLTLGIAMSVRPASVTGVALTGAPPGSDQELLERLSGYPFLFDVEALCWAPWLRLDPVRLLRQHARRHGVVVVWPGRVRGRTVTFSAPGRRDYVNVAMADFSVMQPIPTRFHDQVPFTIERVPA
jgi:hypothetical protein